MRQIAIKMIHKHSAQEFVVTGKLTYTGDSLSLMEHAIHKLFDKKWGKDYTMMYWYLL